MKKLFSIVSVVLLMLAAEVQAQSTVTINVVGNRTKQIAVDGQNYTINNTSATGEQAIEITTLQAGQHQLDVYRNVNRTSPTRKTFTLREGYDMEITIASNGSISTSETRARTGGWRDRDNDGTNSISSAAFTRLLNNTKAKTSSSARATFLETELGRNRMYTSSQVKQLIQLVNSESSRLRLAKLAYPKVTDRANYSQVTNLLYSSSNRRDLTDYMATVPLTTSTDSNAAYTAMSTERFNTIYNEVVAESSSADRAYYLNNFFNKDMNYYTSSQVRQLLLLVSAEGDRLTLAKNAYSNVTDRENFYSQISPLLNSSYNRSDLQTYINNNVNNTTGSTGTGMLTTTFNNLYQNVSYQTNQTSRYNLINSAFTTANNYFTVAQAIQLLQLLNDENSRLALSKIVYRNLTDRSNYTQFYNILSYQSSRNDLNNYVLNFNNSNGNTTTYPGSAMSDVDFNNLYRNVNNSWSASTRFTQISTAFQNVSNYFTASQVRQLLLLVTGESDRLALAKLAYDNLVDKYTYTQLYDVFNSTTSRDEFARYVSDVNSGGTGTSYRVAMTDSEFKSIYRSIQLTFGLGAKMSSLTETFNKETNYFTVAQIKQLIPLVSSESNRLELAKLAYNNAVDPENYLQLNDIFSSQSSRDELAAYIGTIR